MAKSGPGYALYFQREGLVRLEASQAAFCRFCIVNMIIAYFPCIICKSARPSHHFGRIFDN